MWKPIVTNKLDIDLISKKIEEINNAIRKNYCSTNDIGLIYGDTGILMFISYYDKFSKSKSDGIEFPSLLLENIFNTINTGFNVATFSNGLSGVLWGLKHQIEEGFIELEDFDNCLLNEYVGKELITHAKASNYDFLHGSVGIGHGLLHLSNNFQNDYFEEWINIISENSLNENNMTNWKSKIYLGKSEQTEVINFSLSHGMSAIIILLCDLYKIYPKNNLIKELIYRSINYILSKKNMDNKKYTSIYPGYVIENEPHSRNSRMAWCNGELGIAMAFHKAGITFNDREILNEAWVILDHASKRQGLETQSVYDTGFCHGTIGIAHIFNRFYQKTMNESYKNASLYWLNETFNLCKHDNGLAGFKKYDPNKGLVNEIGFLDGIAGIGLVLISLISDIEPKWDRALLMS